MINGGSVIVGPLGDVLAGPIYGQEAVLTADIDDVIRGKYDLDVSGHYARPDVFRLEVDRNARASANNEREQSHRLPTAAEGSWTLLEAKPG